MRDKQLRLIVTFHTTTDAMAMERICMKQNVPGRLIPVPRQITASCGMSWSAPVQARELIETTAKAAGIEADGCYELFI